MIDDEIWDQGVLESVEVDGIASLNTMRNFGSWTALTEVDFSGNGVSYIDESVVSNTCLKIRKFGIKKDDERQISTPPPQKKKLEFTSYFRSMYLSIFSLFCSLVLKSSGHASSVIQHSLSFLLLFDLIGYYLACAVF